MPHLRKQVLVTAEELRDQLSASSAKTPTVLLDVRWTFDQPDGRADYLAGHIPGAIYVPLDEELAAPPSVRGGRYPLPELMNLEASARRWGLHHGDRVVAYDDIGGFGAARAWWLLRWAGVVGARILDGGLAAWREIGGELQSGDVRAPRGSIELLPDNMTIIDADGASQIARHGTLIDARLAQLYAGGIDPYSPVRGHIPGAVSVPAPENLDDRQRFLPSDRLRERFSKAGLIDTSKRVGVYCSSSINASHAVAALAATGYKAALYPGSWVEWTADPDRPIELGEGPGSERI